MLKPQIRIPVRHSLALAMSAPTSREWGISEHRTVVAKVGILQRHRWIDWGAAFRVTITGDQEIQPDRGCSRKLSARVPERTHHWPRSERSANFWGCQGRFKGHPAVLLPLKSRPYFFSRTEVPLFSPPKAMGLLAEMLKNVVKWSAGDLNQPLEWPIELQDQENRTRH